MARPKSAPPPNPYGLAPVQVAGLSRVCVCNVIVRKGIMWERGEYLYCSKTCAIESLKES